MITEAENLVPDFDDFEQMLIEVARVRAEILTIKSATSRLEAHCMRVALTDNTYWVGGKRPSMAYCEKIVKELGNTEEDSTRLNNLRTELANKTETYQLLQGLIALGKDKLSLYQTISANTRKSFL